MALIHAGRRSWREAQTARSGARAAARGANGARDAMQRYKAHVVTQRYNTVLVMR